MIFHPIHHTFAPHVDAEYAWTTFKLIIRPWKWQKGKETDELRAALTQHFQADATIFASGREALLALLQSLNIGKGDEVIIQSYTCLVVPNAITASGAAPVYADIDPETLNLTPETVERVISNRTKAIICQHTFGIPADTERLREVCDQYELPLIEDCAHIIPDSKGPKEIGRYGDYLILSFGRDKAISGITGGALIIKKSCHLECPASASPSIQSFAPLRITRDDTAEAGCIEGATQLPTFTITRLLLYPLIYFFARPLYGIGIGKILLWFAAKCGLLLPIVTKEEKEGHMRTTLHTIPNACAALALMQLKRLRIINNHRRMLTKFYLQACKDHGWPVLEGITEDLPLQKFPMFIPSPSGGGLGRGGQRNSSTPSPVSSPLGRGEQNTSADHLRSILKRRNIHLSDGWTGCKGILSLPTHPTMTTHQSQTLVEILEKFL